MVRYCRKYTVERRRAALSSWISSLVLRRLRWSSCSVPAVVMAWDGPGPPGGSAGVHTRRSRGHVEVPDPSPSGRRIRMVSVGRTVIGAVSSPSYSAHGSQGTACSRGYKRGERGRKSPKSQLGVESVEISCNTRFIKEHKPSNHIRARIKSHVYTTE